jgi:hypothetical protein
MILAFQPHVVLSSHWNFAFIWCSFQLCLDMLVDLRRFTIFEREGLGILWCNVCWSSEMCGTCSLLLSYLEDLPPIPFVRESSRAAFVHACSVCKISFRVSVFCWRQLTIFARVGGMLPVRTGTAGKSETMNCSGPSWACLASVSFRGLQSCLLRPQVFARIRYCHDSLFQ